MEKIILNTVFATGKSAFNLKMELSNTPNNSTTKFSWGDFRFTVEHVESNCWTIAIEKIETNEPELLLYEIDTRLFSNILDNYLI